MSTGFVSMTPGAPGERDLRQDSHGVVCKDIPAGAYRLESENAQLSHELPEAHSPDRAWNEPRLGVVLGLAAYLWWGFAPIYFKAVASVPTWEVLAHRVVWSAPLLNLLLILQSRWRSGLRTIWHRKTAITLLCSTVLIACNWLTFIYAVTSGQLLEASLGYFMNPLFNVILGCAVLGERLRKWQGFSVLLAGGGVVYFTVRYGAFPWISVVLAGSFAVYGLLRKVVRADSLVALSTETTLLCLPALGYLFYLSRSGGGTFGSGAGSMNLLLISAGLITALPLLMFASAARRLRYSTLGFLQYIAPTGHFLLAVVLYNESFTVDHVIMFGCIWTALAVFSFDTYLGMRATEANRNI